MQHPNLLIKPSGAGNFWRLQYPVQTHQCVPVVLRDCTAHVILARKDDPYWCVPQFGKDRFDFIGDGQLLLWQDMCQRHHLWIPLVHAGCRTTLTCNGNALHFTVEVPSDGQFHHPLLCYSTSGDDPLELLDRAATDISTELQTVSKRRDKPTPAWLDLFGWCTWDAFYQDVNAQVVVKALEGWKLGGITPSFIILDDGWQDSSGDYLNTFNANPDKFPTGLPRLVAQIRKDYNIEVFGVWHTLQGYWAGLNPRGDLARQFKTLKTRNRIRPWLGKDDPEIDLILLEREHAAEFFAQYHKILKSAGVSMVKVDNQSALERFTEGVTDRVPTMTAFQAGLQQSIAGNMPDGSLHCMSHSSDVFFNMLTATAIRNSADYLPAANDDHQKGHVARNAFNALYFSMFGIPDWDMFQTAHKHSVFHAVARALSGGPIYVSDKPGKHNFELIKKLIYRDGLLNRPLRCPQPALPSPACLYQDPQLSNTLLKIFNHVNGIGLLGIFNCSQREGMLEDTVTLQDIPVLQRDRRHAVWQHFAKQLVVISGAQTVACSLASMDCELLTAVPVSEGVAPLGLLNKFNAPATISNYTTTADSTMVSFKDGGTAAFYSQNRPHQVEVNGEEKQIDYDESSGLLKVEIPEGQPNTVILQYNPKG